MGMSSQTDEHLAATRVAVPEPTGMERENQARFVRENTRLMPVSHVPEIHLHLADEAVPLWQKTELELETAGLPAPFWAFAWAGGQALARYLLDHPATVRGKRVLDLGTGSGLVAIAAAKAGAAAVCAVDIDPLAIAAVGVNAEANGVGLETLRRNVLGDNSGDFGIDVVLAADLFYERDFASQVMAYLERSQAQGRTVLIGDPGRTYLPRQRLTKLCAYSVQVSRDIEDHDVKHTAVWMLAEAPA